MNSPISPILLSAMLLVLTACGGDSTPTDAIDVQLDNSQEVRDYAQSKGLEAKQAIEAGLSEKSEQFRRGGAQIYS